VTAHYGELSDGGDYDEEAPFIGDVGAEYDCHSNDELGDEAVESYDQNEHDSRDHAERESDQRWADALREGGHL
jgi:hypothetical protein